MLKSVEWSEDRIYKTGSQNEPFEYYLKGLCHSSSFDLLLGYFSSGAIKLLSLGFATFLYKGGNVRLVINNVLSQNDKDALNLAEEGYTNDTRLDFSNINTLHKSLNENGKHFFECLSWLIAKKRIQLKIIRPKDGRGISHYKSGLFFDGKDYVGYDASCNFTAYGLLDNLEKLKTYLSWENERSYQDIEVIKTDIDQIFEEKAPHVEYLNSDDIEVAIRKEFGDKTINELLVQEGELLKKQSQVLNNKKVKKAIENAIALLEEIESTPRFPFPEGPRAYQREAYDNWVANNYQGIFAMATGTGKTITSLNCLLEESRTQKDRIYHAIILVPTITLVNQWADEAMSFNFQEVIKVSSKYQWESELATTLSTAKRIPTSFIIITTYASFVKDRFYKYIAELPDDTVFIADEAHNTGSPTVLERLKGVTLGKRIGLSATPKRIYDVEGSAGMEEFFNDSEPYTYSFSMEKAITEGILCKYYYHPHIVQLTSDELKEYMEITKKLSKFFDSKSGSFEITDVVQMLLLKRKRIIHKAVNKLAATRKILQDRFNKEGHLKYTFVYVPEGSTPDLEEDDQADDETINIINQYTREIGRIDDSIRVNQFVSGMANRNEVLDQFKDGRIDVIASMKCLDEGVDIPRAEHAIFCSSTGNPRQFIQRRGRILRKHADKDIAVIHDLIIIPNLIDSDANSDTFRAERSLVEKELERVMYFASLSINPFETESVFEEVCQHYDLNIYTIHDKLKNNA